MRPDSELVEDRSARRVRAVEFLWEHHGPRDIHAHVARPIVSRLASAGAYTVLDMGCGNGWFTAGLDRCGFKVTGIDRSESGLRIARAQYPELVFRQQDINEDLLPPLQSSFDAVVAIDLVDHLEKPRKLMEAALAALKPGGLLLVTSPFHGYMKNIALAVMGRFDTRWDVLTEHSRVRFFSRDTLTALMREFDVEDLRFETVGRIPMFARAMVVAGRAPI